MTGAAARAVSVGVSLIVGSALWALVLKADVAASVPMFVLLAAAVALVSIPPARRAVNAGFARVRHLPIRSARLASIAIAVLAGIYLFGNAWVQGADFIMKLVDEPSYLIQARMLAVGRLWMPPHPPDVRPFFDTFSMLVEPTYGSMYFPGTALFHVPGVWLGLPYWATSLVIAAACVGLFYRLMLELLDGVYAIIAVLLLLGLSFFRALSIMLLSQTPMLLLALLMLLAYLRWRQRQDWRWAAAIGALAGWAAITRPADALCYALPIGAAMLLDLWQAHRPTASDAATRSLRPWLSTAAALVLAAMPFLGLQLVQNVGMTGDWREFPEARYAQQVYPAPMLGFHSYDLATWQRPPLLQKRLVSEYIANTFYADHRPGNVARVWWEARLPDTFHWGLPHPLLVILLPVGVLGLLSRPARAMASVLVLFIAFYAFYVFYIPHYMVVLAPVLILLTLAGARAVESAVAAIRPSLRDVVTAALPLFVAGLAVSAAPSILRGGQADEAIFGAAELPFVEQAIRELQETLPPSQRAIVLFRYDPRVRLPSAEPVFNADVPWPDDARVVRAHDRGAANVDLFRYFASTRGQSDRLVFLYDRAVPGPLTALGTVGELLTTPPTDAERHPTSSPTSTTAATPADQTPARKLAGS